MPCAHPTGAFPWKSRWVAQAILRFGSRLSGSRWRGFARLSADGGPSRGPHGPVDVPGCFHDCDVARSAARPAAPRARGSADSWTPTAASRADDRTRRQPPALRPRFRFGLPRQGRDFLRFEGLRWRNSLTGALSLTAATAFPCPAAERPVRRRAPVRSRGRAFGIRAPCFLAMLRGSVKAFLGLARGASGGRQLTAGTRFRRATAIAHRA